MRLFVTGAAGWIGSALVPDLLAHGHEVVGLARNDANAERLSALGASVHRGDLTDLDSLRAGARDADGVVHLAYVHDFTRFEDSGRIDAAAVETFGEELAGTDRPFVIASGTLGVTAPGRAATERDEPDLTTPLSGRAIVAASVKPAVALVVDTANTTFAAGVPCLTSPGSAENDVIVATVGSSKTSVYGGFAASESSSGGDSAMSPRLPSLESSSCAGE